MTTRAVVPIDKNGRPGWAGTGATTEPTLVGPGPGAAEERTQAPIDTTKHLTRVAAILRAGAIAHTTSCAQAVLRACVVVLAILLGLSTPRAAATLGLRDDTALSSGRQYTGQAPQTVAAYLPVAVRDYPVSPPPPPPTLVEHGQFGGRASDVVVVGQLAYLAIGAHMIILDVSGAAAPTLVGQTDALPGFVSAVAVRDGTAYLALGTEPDYYGDGGLYTYDVRDPSSPRRLGSLQPGVAIVDVELGSGFAYLYEVDWGTGGLVVDIRDPARPTLVDRGHFVPYWAPAQPGGYVVTGDLMITAYGDVFDLTDPATPRLLAEFGPEEATIIAVQDALVAVADPYTGHIGLYDMSRPEQPRQLADFDLYQALNEEAEITARRESDVIMGLALEGTTLVASGSAIDETEQVSGLLAVVDISEVARPQLRRASTYDCGDGLPGLDCGAVQGMAATLVNGRVVVAAARAQEDWFGYRGAFCGLGGSLIVFDIAPDATPVPRGAWHAPLAPGAIVASDGNALFTLYATGTHAGLEILDLSSPARPVVASALPWAELSVSATGDTPTGVVEAVANGGSLWLAQPGGIRRIDVTDLAAPKVGGAILTDRLDATSHNLTISDGMLFYLEAGEVVAHDIRDPRSPRQVGRLAVGDGSDQLVVGNGYGYLGGGPQVRVLDVRDAGAMREVNQIDGGGSPARLALQGTELYVIEYASDAAGNFERVLRVYSLGDPMRPRRIGTVSIDPYGLAYDMVAPSGHVYIMDVLGIYEIDVRRPASPVRGVTHRPPAWLCAETMWCGSLEGAAVGAEPMHVARGHLYMTFGSCGGTAYEMAGDREGNDATRQVPAGRWSRSQAVLPVR